MAIVVNTTADLGQEGWGVFTEHVTNEGTICDVCNGTGEDPNDKECCIPAACTNPLCEDGRIGYETKMEFIVARVKIVRIQLSIDERGAQESLLANVDGYRIHDLKTLWAFKLTEEEAKIERDRLAKKLENDKAVTQEAYKNSQETG